MTLDFETHERTLLVKLDGELDHHATLEVREKIDNRLLSNGMKNLILDFEKVSFMDSSGIGIIVGRYKLVTAIGGKMAVIAVNSQMERLFSVSGIKKLISIYSTAKEAIKAVAM